MSKNLTLGLCVLALALAGCAPSPAAIAQAVGQTQAAWTPVPTQTALPTLTARPTFTQPATQTAAPTIAIAVTVIVTAEVTRIVDRPVTVTPTQTPLESPTITSTPSDTPIPSSTPRPTVTPSDTPTPNEAKTATAAAFAALTAPIPDGNYLVNVDIAPGHWRNDGSASDGTNCYWERLDKSGNIIDNYIGAGNGAVFISPNDFQFHMENCGTWSYIGP